MPQRNNRWVREGVTWVVFLLWLLMFLISLDHLYPFCPFFSQLPTRIIGNIGWLTLVLTIFYCADKHLTATLLIAFLFFGLGKLSGPFLEPPSDPLEHLRRVYEWNCDQSAYNMPRNNRGFWHYSMAGNLLCSDGKTVPPIERLQRIDNVHGLFWALAAATLFVLSLQAGLPRRWAFLSLIICFLFFGTNRFSYFRYYSLAPGFSSLIIYWIWTGLFFFTKKSRNLVTGFLCGLIALPILWVNHQQEAVFLGFIIIVWLLVHCLFHAVKIVRLFSNRNSKQVWIGLLCLLTFFSLGWLLPQSQIFRHWLEQFFVRDYVRNLQPLSSFCYGFYVGPQFTGLRVFDTLGGAGILMGLLGLPYFWPGFIPGDTERKIRIFILGVLPFVGYFTPLFHFIWSSNVKVPTYYRLCYASMFWIFFADFLYRSGHYLFRCETIQSRHSQGKHAGGDL